MKKNGYLIVSTVIATVALLGFYFVLMRLLSGSWNATFSQFRALWYFMLPLSIGFGLQVGLYIRLREITKHHRSNGVMMTNTTTSTVGMIAYCAHHIADVLPILGVSALSLFLVRFQTSILIIGIFSNGIGIFYMVKTIKNQKIN